MTPFAAFLLGLLASGHCVLMCGGITSALGLATAKRADGRPRRLLLLGYQFGRISSYTLAGLLIGSVGGAFIDAADDELMHVFRTADERLYAAKEAGRNRAVLA